LTTWNTSTRSGGAPRYRFLRDHAMVSIDDDSAGGHVAREAENLDALVERLSENDP